MGNIFIVLVLFFPVTIFLGRKMEEQAIKKLSLDKMTRLRQISTPFRRIEYLLAFVILLVIFVHTRYDAPASQQLLAWLTGIGIFGFFVSVYLQLQQLRKHGFPSAYIRTFLKVASFQAIGFTVIGIWLILERT